VSLKEALGSEKILRTNICTVETLLSKLDEDDQEALIKALSDSGVPSTFIARALKKEGFDVASQSLARHRRQECRCGA
jgi:hypothetical protein